MPQDGIDSNINCSAGLYSHFHKKTQRIGFLQHDNLDSRKPIKVEFLTFLANKNLAPFFVSISSNFGYNIVSIFHEKLITLCSLVYPYFDTILLFGGTAENFPSEILLFVKKLY
jgi:hypothetical protein